MIDIHRSEGLDAMCQICLASLNVTAFPEGFGSFLPRNLQPDEEISYCQGRAFRKWISHEYTCLLAFSGPFRFSIHHTDFRYARVGIEKKGVSQRHSVEAKATTILYNHIVSVLKLCELAARFCDSTPIHRSIHHCHSKEEVGFAQFVEQYYELVSTPREQSTSW